MPKLTLLKTFKISLLWIYSPGELLLLLVYYEYILQEPSFSFLYSDIGTFIWLFELRQIPVLFHMLSCVISTWSKAVLCREPHSLAVNQRTNSSPIIHAKLRNIYMILTALYIDGQHSMRKKNFCFCNILTTESTDQSKLTVSKSFKFI